MNSNIEGMKENDIISKALDKHSDYGMPDPYWINLPDSDVELSAEVKQQISDSLNEWFEEHGPDANEDFTAFSSCLMTYETAEEAVKYACAKAGLDQIPDYIIAGTGSIVTDGRENDPVTGELLHGYPIHAASIIDELTCLNKQNELSEDDWRFIDMAFNSYQCCGYIMDNEEQDSLFNLIFGLVEKFTLK